MNSTLVSASTASSHVPAGVVRRIGSIIYDALLVIAVLAVATLPFLLVVGKTLVPSMVGWWIYSAYLAWQLLVVIAFFGLFWTRGGQTLGMQVWKLRVEDEQGNLLSWHLVLRRLLFATVPWVPGLALLTIAEEAQSPALKLTGKFLLLLGLLNIVVAKFSSDHRTWHDQMSGTRVVINRRAEGPTQDVGK